MTAPIDVYYWPTPNGHKVTIALEEMGLAYAIKPVNIGAGDQFQPDFLAISPNNRMPAIVDPDGPDGQSVSVFESGAILQYLGRKTGRFYGAGERDRIAVEEWLMWQMGGVGPMAGQANHFRNYVRGILSDQRMIAYGAHRYTNEVHRLFGVLDRRLQGRPFVAGDYSIADMAIWSWFRTPGGWGVDLAEFPAAKTWIETIAARPAVQRAMAVADEVRKGPPTQTLSGPEGDKARALLFGLGKRG